MRKESRFVEKIVKEREDIFIADDGQEFSGYNAEQKCKEYEHDIMLDKAKDACSHLKLDDLDGLSPLTLYGDLREYDTYWYSVANANDFDLVEQYAKLAFYDTNFYEPKSYPAILCICDFDGYSDVYYLEDIIEEARGFFGLFKKKMEISDK